MAMADPDDSDGPFAPWSSICLSCRAALEGLSLLGEPRPCGASRGTASGPRRSERRGRAEGRPGRSPLGREPCLAYGLALLTNRPAIGQRDVLWREAATVGFNVRLDQGGTVRIAPGRVRFEVDR